MKTPIFDGLLLALVDLGVRPDEATLLGSATLAVRGWRDVRDLDVLASLGAVSRLLLDEPNAEIMPNTKDSYAVALKTPAGIIQVSDKLYNFATRAKISELDIELAAEVHRGWKVLSLEHLIQIKKAVGRVKDFDDLELIARMVRENHTQSE